MTDMQEMVARAIAGICNDKGQELASKCEMQAPPIPWQAFEREAKAAIEAHEKALEAEGLVIVPREPTEYMTHLGESNAEDTVNEFHGMILRACGCPECDKSSHEAFRAIWQAMIDEALTKKDETT